MFTHADFHQGGADYSFISSVDEVPDFIRIQPAGNNSGSIEVQLPDAAAFPGVRVTIRHYGGTSYPALINPQAEQRVDGNDGTYSLAPFARITLQSGVYAGVPGWESI